MAAQGVAQVNAAPSSAGQQNYTPLAKRVKKQQAIQKEILRKKLQEP